MVVFSPPHSLPRCCLQGGTKRTNCRPISIYFLLNFHVCFILTKHLSLLWVLSPEQQEVERVQHSLDWDFELYHLGFLPALATLLTWWIECGSLTREDMQMASKQMKRWCSTLYVLREHTMRYNYTPTKIAENSKHWPYWWGCEPTGTLAHCWWELKW